MKKYILSSLSIALLMAGCIKEDQILHPKDSNPVLEIYNHFPHKIASTTLSKFAMFNESFPAIAGEKQTYTITVNYAGADNAPEDITVNLGLNLEAIDVYNAQFNIPDTLRDVNGDDSLIIEHQNFMIPLPASLYEVATWTTTIKKGEKQASINVIFDTYNFDFDKNYVFPVQIQSASSGTISGNYGTVIFSIKPKNKYDGIYRRTSRLEVTADRPGVYSPNSFVFPYAQHYITINATTLEYFDAGFSNDWTLTFMTPTGGWSRWGQYNPVFVFDPATDEIVSVRNGWTTTTNGRTASLNTNETSRYDEATKTIYAAYYMNQTGNLPLPIYDTLVFVGERP